MLAPLFGRSSDKDVTTLEAIFDLVDNSIDAARDWLIANKCNRGKDNLPLTYDGFYVCIRIDEDSIRVLDNCAGIDRETLPKEHYIRINHLSTSMALDYME